MPWAFKDLCDGRKNLIREWLDAQPEKVRHKFDQTLRNLQLVERMKPPFMKKIHGHKNVFEVVITVNKVQYRPLGGYGPERSEFTFVMGAIEHNDNIRPPGAFQTAEGLIADVNNKTRGICDHVYEKPSKEVA